MSKGTYVLRGNQERKYARSKTFNIDNGSGTTDDDVLLVPSVDIRIIGASIVYVEATDTTGAAGANVKLGTAAAGEQIVAATNLGTSKAVGAKTALTLTSARYRVPAGTGVFARHTGIAATEAGQYFIQLEYTEEN